MIYAIDPGTEQSAWLEYDGMRPVDYGVVPNDELLRKLRINDHWRVERIVLEGIACHGMPVGAETFTTCIWIGRFVEAWGGHWDLVYRNDVKLHLCQSPRAKDPMVRQALIDKFGGESKAIGGVKCETCKGVGTRGYLRADCAECFGTGTVTGVRNLKNCPKCKGKCFVRGERSTCHDCRGSKWKHPPGPLFGIATHCWSALAVAVTFTEKRELAKAI